jgi:hypothetical protein
LRRKFFAAIAEDFFRSLYRMLRMAALSDLSIVAMEAPSHVFPQPGQHAGRRENSHLQNRCNPLPDGRGSAGNVDG